MKRNHSTRWIKATCLALAATLPGAVLATTLTFDGDPDYANNFDVNGAYGSAISSDSPEFVTTDELGVTPNVALSWPLGSDFEYHSDTRWQNIEDVSDAEAIETRIVQVNLGSFVETSITFTPDPGYAIVFGSVDFGYGADFGGGSGVGVATITRDLDSAVVLTVSTSSLNAGDAETLDLGFSGVLGESYTLTFSDTTDTTEGGTNSNWAAIDDLSFGQTQNPGSPIKGPLNLVIEPNAQDSDQLNFTWVSRENRVYDLVSATNLSAPVREWSIWENREGISSTPPLNIESNVSAGAEGQRFFALVERIPE